MKYCKRCLYPDAKPDLQIFSDGLCAACHSFDNRDSIDYAKRKLELVEILEKYRSKDGSNYDCIIPGSGGKDSSYQALKVRELGFNPLIVTITTDRLTELGRRNIENLKNNGFDYIEVTPNPALRRRINRLGLEVVCDCSWPEHVLIFSAPIRVAVQMNIPLVIYGECPQNEYGGPDNSVNNRILDRKWMEEFGGLLGMRVSDLPEMLNVSPKELIQYTYPGDDDIRRVGVTGIFLGAFMPWDGYHNALYAQAHGFEMYPKNVEGSLFGYENLDNCFTGLHDVAKYWKYGFGRATDIACNHIRRGRMTREEGLKFVKERDGKFPWSYLGYPIQTILDDMGMTLGDLEKVMDRTVNRKIFECDASGKPIKDSLWNLTVKHG